MLPIPMGPIANFAAGVSTLEWPLTFDIRVQNSDLFLFQVDLLYRIFFRFSFTSFAFLNSGVE